MKKHKQLVVLLVYHKKIVNMKVIQYQFSFKIKIQDSWETMAYHVAEWPLSTVESSYLKAQTMNLVTQLKWLGFPDHKTYLSC